MTLLLQLMRKIAIARSGLPENQWLHHSNEEDRWLEFGNCNNQEWMLFIVYVDLEYILCKTESNNREDASSYKYQQHEVFSIGYYIRYAHYCRITSVTMKTV